MDSWVSAILITILSCICSISFLFFRAKTRKNDSLGLPPGPRGLPLIGHLHRLDDLSHHNLQKLAKQYGPIMSMRLGRIHAIIISSPEYAEMFLKTHDLVFASRPKLQAADYLLYGQKNLVFAQYGPYWRNIRSLCTIKLLSSTKIRMFRSMRQEEVSIFVKSMKDASAAGGTVDVSAKIESLVDDMTYRLVVGTKDGMLKFKEAMLKGVRLAGMFNLADFVPFLGTFDLQGLKPQMKAVTDIIDPLMEKIINDHARDAKISNGGHKDFVDVLLSVMESNSERELQIERDQVKAILLDMLAASMDTSSKTIDWVIAELLRHPRVMKLVQQELETVVGLDRMVDEADLSKLDYLKLVIKENMRIHPVAPLLIPHESVDDIIINGYFIPKNSRVLINTWSIGRDTNVWSDNAEEFYPERFAGTGIDIKGNDFRFLPFGSGRRICPGMQLGMKMVLMIVAQLVHCFDLALPDGMAPEELDMTEKFGPTFGITISRGNHLLVIPTYRLNI